MSRPSEFSGEIADLICERLVGGQSLRSICAADDMPNCSTVFRWLAANEGFREQYAHAREAQADALFDESLDISDDKSGDVQRDRLRVDTRKWMAGKLKPKKYGDKLDLNHSGGIQVETVKRVIHDPRNPDSEDIQPAS